MVAIALPRGRASVCLNNRAGYRDRNGRLSAECMPWFYDPTGKIQVLRLYRGLFRLSRGRKWFCCGQHRLDKLSSIGDTTCSLGEYPRPVGVSAALR
jgi:hypothetical protein